MSEVQVQIDGRLYAFKMYLLTKQAYIAIKNRPCGYSHSVSITTPCDYYHDLCGFTLPPNPSIASTITERWFRSIKPCYGGADNSTSTLYKYTYPSFSLGGDSQTQRVESVKYYRINQIAGYDLELAKAGWKFTRRLSSSLRYLNKGSYALSN